jgi:hypothetical protein
MPLRTWHCTGKVFCSFKCQAGSIYRMFCDATAELQERVVQILWNKTCLLNCSLFWHCYQILGLYGHASWQIPCEWNQQMYWVPILLVVIIILHVSGSLSAQHQELLSRTAALVQFMQLGYRVLPGSGRNGSRRSPRRCFSISAFSREKEPVSLGFCVQFQMFRDMGNVAGVSQQQTYNCVLQKPYMECMFEYTSSVKCGELWLPNRTTAQPRPLATAMCEQKLEKVT